MHPIALISRYGESKDRRDCGVMSVLGQHFLPRPL
jgi:hypothetical protein